jgi:AmmeMemoRadiSam system protein B
VNRARLRPAIAAGTFYTEDARILASEVDALLDSADAGTRDGTPIALVVPHAGYAYSGAVAARAYALVRGSGMARVAVLGPAHFVALSGSAVPEASAWRMPLGDVPIDDMLRRVALAAQAFADDRPHVAEHAAEVQLPFLRRALGEQLSILPVAVGSGPPAAAAALIAELTPHALVVISTDLSHFHDADTARRLDGRTIDAVLERDPTAIADDAACGSYALRGFVTWARDADAQLELLDARTSADAGGDPSRVVGYASFAAGRDVTGRGVGSREG